MIEKEYNKYLKSYPALKDEELYILNANKQDILSLEKVMSKPLLINFNMKDTENLPFEIPEGVDIFQMMEQMSQEQRNEKLEQLLLAYRRYFDIKRDIEIDGDVFSAFAEDRSDWNIRECRN